MAKGILESVFRWRLVQIKKTSEEERKGNLRFFFFEKRVYKTFDWSIEIDSPQSNPKRLEKLTWICRHHVFMQMFVTIKNENGSFDLPQLNIVEISGERNLFIKLETKKLNVV